MRYGSPVQIPAENICGLSMEAPGGLCSQFTGGGIPLDSSIAAAGVELGPGAARGGAHRDHPVAPDRRGTPGVPPLRERLRCS